MLKEKLIASVTTDCQCQTENDETGEFGPSNECFGDCYEWQKEDVFYLLGEWQLANGVTEDDTIVVTGSGMGWQRQTGYAHTDILNLDSVLSLNGDFRIEWYLEDKTLTAMRWSHDEPTGTGLFHFEIVKGE